MTVETDPYDDVTGEHPGGPIPDDYTGEEEEEKYTQSTLFGDDVASEDSEESDEGSSET